MARTKFAPLNMRQTPEMRARLEAAARQSGRSLAQEVEWRIERSFAEEDILTRIDQTIRAASQGPRFPTDLRNYSKGSLAWLGSDG